MKVAMVTLGIVLFTCAAGLVWAQSEEAPEPVKSLYDFTLKDIDGKPVKLDAYKGKVLLVVNTASFCGYTPQYKDLMEIYKKYHEQGFEILAFPANDFKQQEPGTNDEIKEFCTTKYDVKFPLFSKISVIGDEQHPLFKYLTARPNPDFTGDIQWNFEKFLIGRDGNLLHRFRSKTSPASPELTGAVEAALKAEKPADS